MDALKNTKYSKKIEGFTMFPKAYDGHPLYLMVDEILQNQISPRFDEVLMKFENDKRQTD